MSDKRLIDELRRGQSTAWAEMVRLYLKLVYHVVRKTLTMYGRGGTEQDVEDVTNDLFQSFVRDDYRALGTIGEPYDLKAWLAVSARRRAIDFVRRKRVASVSLDEPREGEEIALGAALAASPPGDDESGREEYRSAVAESLGSLNSKERLVVELFYLNGRKYREISQLTGMNPNSISPTLARAVEKMQKYLVDRNLLSR